MGLFGDFNKSASLILFFSCPLLEAEGLSDLFLGEDRT